MTLRREALYRFGAAKKNRHTCTAGHLELVRASQGSSHEQDASMKGEVPVLQKDQTAPGFFCGSYV
jgi:hypothetical protein